MVADIAKLSVGREEYYTRELATDHEQYLSGHGESPGRWYGAGASSLGLQGEASPAGFQAIFEGRHPRPGSCSAAPMAATPCQALMWSCGRPRVSLLYGLSAAGQARSGPPANGPAVGSNGSAVGSG